MATGQKLYPRATVKKIVKAHSKRNVTKNVDVLIFLDYALFLQTLMKEAGINAKQAGERGISAKSVKKVTEVFARTHNISSLKLTMNTNSCHYPNSKAKPNGIFYEKNFSSARLTTSHLLPLPPTFDNPVNLPLILTMAAATTQNPAVKPESKSAKKKKAKSASAEPEISAAPAVEATPSNGPAESNSGDGSYESPYIKELYKNIRNVNKKITNASKVDSIVAENPSKTLDELVAERKINADQKAQILKKPSLQASLTQLEEQIAQYKKFDQEYKARLQAEKADFEKIHTERSSKELEEAVAAAKAEAVVTAQKEQESNLLLLSQFLRLAAIRRGEDEDPELEENKALEGLLAKVYSGDAAAVASMFGLIKGSSEAVTSVNGDILTVTYADIKQVVLAQPPPPTALEVIEQPEESEAVETTEYPVESDPTIANVGLTELDAPAADTLTNGHSEATQEVPGIPQNSGFGEGAANAAAEANWDTHNDLSTSQEWVEVPRDASETDTRVTATPAAPSNVRSWADDQPDSPVETTSVAPANKDDGFHEVQRSRGGRDRGQFRGRGGRGDGYRGRGGFRGDGYRGRGRGGGGGAPRGQRRSDES
ncbi:hypothetical protein G7Y89_g9971 [Cudoniella acicularis]|uniref:YAG7-like dimerisation domain-containing protein n=1 Tax=Cudoniella acicularis TaxID=354080 RepID=A0A8H4RGE5_9HELO|nr:hypothetical protein G7Y89_g9971 [Cudoniella acicularis]